MKTKLSILSLILLFISCSSDDSNDDDGDIVFTEKIIRLELTALVDNPEDYTDIDIELFFSGYTEPEVITGIEADSTEITVPGFTPVDKTFYYSYPHMEESLFFTTAEPVIGGVFSLFSYNSSDEAIYEAKIYLDDELVEEKTFSEDESIFYLMEPEYSFE